MKHTLLASTFLLCMLCLFSCDPEGNRFSEVTTGKVNFTTKESQREIYELTNKNGKQAQTKADPVLPMEIDILNVEVPVIEGQRFDSVRTAELYVGGYTAIVTKFDESEEYRNRAAYKGSADFQIKGGDNLDISIELKPQFTQINIDLVNLPGAKAWAGHVDFEPADISFYKGAPLKVYPVLWDMAVDIIVEFEGRRKTYRTPISLDYVYYVEIVRSDDEQPIDPPVEVDPEATGIVNLDYSVKPEEGQTVSFVF